ncbi:DUF86 domain-containing protein [Oceanobacillus sp. Castelsardo]|uniref:DUF86 domain-containing protein n=1 Tax=Oceanobacillus sp. Castelsardo TaxID=1851204 RepID=UPI000838E232|nr:DUF86 domain-containing protein [Oceanobacillus sp. Castelsardo]
MYFVDRNNIEITLKNMEQLLSALSNNKFENYVSQLAQERIAHILIESILDVGNMMIDGFIMRDPGSYDDIIDILVDEKVIPQVEEKGYKEIISLRRMIVNDYKNVDHKQLDFVLSNNKALLEQFSTHIRTYLESELGVANAFSNHN